MTDHQQAPSGYRPPTVQDEGAEQESPENNPSYSTSNIPNGNMETPDNTNNGADQAAAAAAGGGDPSVPQPMSVVVKTQEGNELTFKIKSTTKLGKVMDAHSARTGQTGMRYLVDGNRVGPDQTPADLEMEDGDIIEAYIEQIGGRTLANTHDVDDHARASNSASDNVNPQDVQVAIQFANDSGIDNNASSATADSLTISVRCGPGEVYYKIRENGSLARLFTHYRGRTGYSSVDFFHDGNLLLETDSASGIGLVDGDVIQAVVQRPELPREQGPGINVEVAHKARASVHFKVKPSSQFEKVAKAYEERDKGVKGCVYSFDGLAVDRSDTIEVLGIEDGGTVWATEADDVTSGFDNFDLR